MPVLLEERAVCNGWTILSRTGAEARMQKLPRYIVSTPDKRHVECFKLFGQARHWCEQHTVEDEMRRRTVETRARHTTEILEKALERHTHWSEALPDGHEAILAHIVEDYIATRGMKAFITHPGLQEVLSVIFAVPVREVWAVRGGRKPQITRSPHEPLPD